ncbi:hypothetical protein BBP40_009512 [Aspergillus hancockii]|nr:hypothetical protein BBP40_009512 [Aspergillus hancockii]
MNGVNRNFGWHFMNLSEGPFRTFNFRRGLGLKLPMKVAVLFGYEANLAGLQHVLHENTSSETDLTILDLIFARRAVNLPFPTDE